MAGRKAILAAAVAAAALATGLNAQPAATTAAAEPYEFSFLDEIEGERALAWARACRGKLQAVMCPSQPWPPQKRCLLQKLRWRATSRLLLNLR